MRPMTGVLWMLLVVYLPPVVLGVWLIPSSFWLGLGVIVLYWSVMCLAFVVWACMEEQQEQQEAGRRQRVK